MSQHGVLSTGERHDVAIPLGQDRLAAWWYPAARDRRPCVLLAHGFGGIKEMRLWAYAERFAEAGLHALVFDYRHFGGSTGEPRGLVDISRQQQDWAAATRFARDLEDVDAQRVALWGTSFSGGQVVIVASADSRIAAVVAQVPFADGRAALAAMPAAHGLGLMWAGLLDAIGTRFGRAPRMLKAAGMPGDHNAVMTTPDAYPGMMRLVPSGLRFDNAVCARIALRVGATRPIRHAPDVACPLPVQVMDHDEVTPAAAAAAMASKAPRGELLAYPGGHFDPYDGPLFERLVSDQVAFLIRHLAPAN
jgi:fermentation-respiration switch protein FrsA (DUF1100 family)